MQIEIGTRLKWTCRTQKGWAIVTGVKSAKRITATVYTSDYKDRRTVELSYRTAGYAPTFREVGVDTFDLYAPSFNVA
jgi:hypothetical protein